MRAEVLQGAQGRACAQTCRAPTLALLGPVGHCTLAPHHLWQACACLACLRVMAHGGEGGEVRKRLNLGQPSALTS